MGDRSMTGSGAGGSERCLIGREAQPREDPTITRKPFTWAELARKVRELLDEAGRSSKTSEG